MNTVYFAKHILLDSGELLYNGAVSVRDGVIVDVGARGKIKRVRNERLVNLGDILLLPGFINLHTHLEESPIRSFSKKEIDETYTDWSIKKYSRMRQLADERVRISIQLCIREMISKGITTIVDNTRTGISAEILAREPVRSAVIMEIAADEFVDEGIGKVREWMKHVNTGAGTSTNIGNIIQTADTDTGYKAARHWSKITDDVSGINTNAGRHIGAAFRYGIAPHALYSLTPRWHRKIIEHSYDSGCLFACHIAESAEELQAFCEHSGDFFFNQTRKKPWPAGDFRINPVQYAFAENLIPSQAILYHCNYVTGNELGLLAAKRAFVTICPGYNAGMGHKSFPVAVACKRGIRICLGTEGMVPAGEMNLFDELFRLKTAYPQISAAEMLQWVTKNPATALRASDKLGSISPGKYADITGVRFPYDDGDDILETLIMSDPQIALVMIGGEEVIIDR